MKKKKIYFNRLSYLFSLPGRIAIEYNCSLNLVKGLFSLLIEHARTKKELKSMVKDCLERSKNNGVSTKQAYNELYN